MTLQPEESKKKGHVASVVANEVGDCLEAQHEGAAAIISPTAK